MPADRTPGWGPSPAWLLSAIAEEPDKASALTLAWAVQNAPTEERRAEAAWQLSNLILGTEHPRLPMADPAAAEEWLAGFHNQHLKEVEH